jgi:hypothetical protein
MEDSILIIILTGGCSILALLIRYMFKSKCDQVNLCWGLLQIHRKIENEQLTNDNQNDFESHKISLS